MFCEISGYTKNELVGKNHRIINSGHHSKEFWENYWTTINSGKVWRGEIKNRKKNGDYYWVKSLVCPQFDNAGVIKSYVSFRSDITEAKKNEEVYAETKALSLHLGKLAELGEISAGIAHEINNPMTIISGKFKILKRKFEEKFGEDVDCRRHLEAIDYAVDRVVKIVQNLRTFSQNSSNSKTVFEQTTTSKLIESTLLLTAQKIKDDGIRLDVAVEESDVYCSFGYIEQVILNLILNSAYEVQKLADKWVAVNVVSKGDFVEFSVTDSGTGIPIEVQEKLMRPFFTTKPTGQGTGLGLSVAKKIIEQHAGEFFYDSTSKNTRFAFLLPKNKNAVIGALNSEKAITAHLNWKTKLLDEYTHKSNTLNPEVVADCTICDLGKWITKSEEILSDNADFLKLKSVHKNFHQEAANIVKEIQSGSVENIKILISDSDSDSDSDYSKLSRSR